MTDTTATQPESPGSGGLHHAVLLHDSDAEFRAAIADFVREGLAAREPVLVAAPGPRLDALRAALNGSGDAVTFVDVSTVGANPARLIPAR
jgi:MEDS: MEthanogen/methylotroph, DcmR Sensory domain